jgi:protein-S-isoprenylcysteine O-methyltransferase Ste14
MMLSWDLFSRALILTCWSLFGVVWALGALYNVWHAPPAERRRGDFNAWLVGIGLVLLGRIVVPAQVWAMLSFDALPLRIVGTLLLVVATLFTLWARVVLGSFWTTAPVIKHDHQLRTTGPYAFTRHPIYTGMLGMLMGTALLNGLGIWLYYVLVGLIVVKTKVNAEERLLEETFGDRYREYRQRVGQLVPHLS